MNNFKTNFQPIFASTFESLTYDPNGERVDGNE